MPQSYGSGADGWSTSSAGVSTPGQFRQHASGDVVITNTYAGKINIRDTNSGRVNTLS